MILLLDIGNSRIKWALTAMGEASAGGGFPTAELPAWQPPWEAPPEAAVVSCVAATAVLEMLVARLGLDLDRLHVLVSQPQAHGIVNDYDNPATLGADRYAALIAAHRRGLGDCVVVGVGTALTADMLTGEGRYLGGCIAPGPALMRASLASATAQVQVGDEGEVLNLPRDTASGVATGIALALCGVVEGACRQLRSATGRQTGIIVTGGARAALMPCLGTPFLEVENLVLEGLAWIARDLGYVA